MKNLEITELSTCKNSKPDLCLISSILEDKLIQIDLKEFKNINKTRETNKYEIFPGNFQ